MQSEASTAFGAVPTNALAHHSSSSLPPRQTDSGSKQGREFFTS